MADNFVDAVKQYMFGGDDSNSSNNSTTQKDKPPAIEPKLYEGKEAEERFDKNMPSASKFRPQMQDAYQNINWWDVDLDNFEKQLESGEYGEKAAYGKNLAKGNADSNANGLDADDTLRLSQFADYLNNIETNAGDGAESYLLTARKGKVAGKMGNFRKWDPIETEAMRQQRTIADLSKEQQSRKINRQQNYQDMHQKLKEAKLLQKLALEGKATEYEMARLDSLLGELQYQMLEAPYRERMQKRMTVFDKLHIPFAQTSQILYLANGDMVKASMLASLYGTVMASPYQMIAAQMLQGIIKDVRNGNMDAMTGYAEAMERMKEVTGWMYGMGMGAVDGFNQGMGN